MNKNKLHKTKWKAGNMIYPLPAVMISCGDKEIANIVTVAWTGTICTNPPMTYISLRPSRYSYEIIKRTGVFVINLTTEALAYATDFCGVKSGRDIDKFKEVGLTIERDDMYACPMILESPVSIVCRTTEIKPLGSHHMFIAEVKAVYVDESYMNDKGKFELNQTGLIAYSHGNYLKTGEAIGTFGYSVSKKRTAQKQSSKRDKVSTTPMKESLQKKKRKEKAIKQSECAKKGLKNKLQNKRIKQNNYKTNK